MSPASKRSPELTPAERKALADLAPRPRYILPIEALAIGGPRWLAKECDGWDDGTWDQEGCG